MIGIIYLVKNKINNKCYIGQTTQRLCDRKASHVYNTSINKYKSYFYNSLRKYGLENFEWLVLCERYSTDELNLLEIYYIKKFNTLSPNGYNSTLGGVGARGWKHNKDSLRKISDAGKKRKGIKFTAEHCINIGNVRRGKTYEEIYGLKKAFEIKKTIAAANKRRIYKVGWKHSEETKDKMRLSRTGLIQTDQKRERCRKSKLAELNPMYKKINIDVVKRVLLFYEEGFTMSKISKLVAISEYLVKRVLIEENIL